MCEENTFDSTIRKDTPVSTFENSNTDITTVAGLVEALKGFGFAEAPAGISDEEYHELNLAEIALIGDAILAHYPGKKVSVPECRFDDPSGMNPRSYDHELDLKVEGKGHGFDSAQFPTISFRKERRWFGLFGPKVYKIVFHTR